MAEKAKTLTGAQLEQRAKANLRHGARSEVAIAPAVMALRKALLARMGLRQRDLSWAANELLDNYCRAKARVVAIDEWLESHAFIDDDGNTAPPMKLYFVALNAATRTLDTLRGLIAEQAREDSRFDDALTALAAEGARVRAGRRESDGR